MLYLVSAMQKAPKGGISGWVLTFINRAFT